MAGTALPRRLTWQLATVVELVDETPRTRSIVLDLPAWAGHRAGQHVDVRLTAEDGYQAQRSYSIASAPEDEHLMLTVERLDDGEVSPYLVDELILGDQLDPRRDQLRATLPIRRVVQADDVARLAVHIMVNTALTGATFDIDGGQQFVE